MDYKAIRAAIDYVKNPIPDVVIKNNKGGLFSKGNFTLASSSKKEIGDNSTLKLAELETHCPKNCSVTPNMPLIYTWFSY